MSHRTTSILVFIFLIATSVLIIMWVFIWNKGDFVIKATPPYFVSIIGGTGETSFSCEENPCILQLKPGFYTSQFKKDKYFEEQRPIEIKRWKETIEEISFLYTPNNKTLPEEVFMAERPFLSFEVPEAYKDYENSIAFFGSGSFLYFEPTNQEIRHFKNNESILIAQFIGIKSMKISISPDHLSFLGIGESSGVYIGNIKSGNKRKITEDIFSNNIWGPVNEYIIFEDSQGHFKLYDRSHMTFTDLPIDSTLHNLLWIDEHQLIYSNKDGFFFYNIEDRNTEELMISQNELAIDEMFLTEDHKKLFFRREDEYFSLQFRE